MDGTIDKLRKLYEIAIEAFFLPHDDILHEKDERSELGYYYHARTGRKNALPIFFSNFYEFFNGLYPVPKKICGAAPEGYLQPSYDIPNNSGEFFKELEAFTIKNLNTFTFRNSGVKFSKKSGPNILIVGAGPVGLYLAGILKMCAPHLDVNLLEVRVADGERTLSRNKRIEVMMSKMPNNLFAVYKMSELLLNFCPTLLNLFMSISTKTDKPILNLLGHVYTEHKWVAINFLEYKLAKFAQEQGVVIYHDSAASAGRQYIEEHYMNSKTLIMFDSTGGKLVKHPAQFSVVRADQGKSRLLKSRLLESYDVPEGEAESASFDVYEGYLRPEQAIHRLYGYTYIAIGDSFMKTDYRGGAAVSYGAALSVAAVLVILREFLDRPTSRPKSRGRKTRKIASRRPRSL
jgi:hypothetical protein